MDIKFPIYDLVFDEENDDLGLTAISFVDFPAIQHDFVYFSANKSMIVLSDEEKREVVSPILIPNQLIIRQAEDGSYYYIRWSEETIREIALKYAMNGWFNNFNVMHPSFYNQDLEYSDVMEDEVEMLRMWTIEDASTDEINTRYGFDLPKGTLCVHLHVGNEDIWSRIKSGELRGLSIEAFMSMEIKQNKIKEENKMEFTRSNVSLFEKFLAFMNSVREEAMGVAVQASKDEAESGEVSIKYWIDNDHYMSVDADGVVRDEELYVVSEGKYLLMDGNYIEVGKNGKFIGTANADSADNEDETVSAPIAERETMIAQEEVSNEVENEVVSENEREVVENENEGDVVDGTLGDGDAESDGVQDEPSQRVGEGTDESFQVTIGESSFDVSKEVLEYIKSLEGKMSEKDAEIERLSEAKPLRVPMTSESDSIGDMVSRLNRRF